MSSWTNVTKIPRINKNVNEYSIRCTPCMFTLFSILFLISIFNEKLSKLSKIAFPLMASTVTIEPHLNYIYWQTIAFHWRIYLNTHNFITINWLWIIRNNIFSTMNCWCFTRFNIHSNQVTSCYKLFYLLIIIDHKNVLYLYFSIHSYCICLCLSSQMLVAMVLGTRCCMHCWPDYLLPWLPFFQLHWLHLFLT